MYNTWQYNFLRKTGGGGRGGGEWKGGGQDGVPPHRHTKLSLSVCCLGRPRMSNFQQRNWNHIKWYIYMVMIEMVECLFCIHPQNKFFVCVIIQASFFFFLFLFYQTNTLCFPWVRFRVWVNVLGIHSGKFFSPHFAFPFASGVASLFFNVESTWFFKYFLCGCFVRASLTPSGC